MSNSSSKDGEYWPGFVDALTNVVIAMVFVIVVLAIALSFSAQMLAQRMAAKIAEQEVELGKARVVAPGPPAEVEKPRSESLATTTPVPVPVDAQAPVRQRIGVAGTEKALAASSAQARVKPAERFLELVFAPGALTLDADAARQLNTALAPLRERLAELPGSRIAVVAIGPEIHLSENQRAAFIRAMGVRNQLLEQGIAGERIAARIDMNATAAVPTVTLRVEEIR